MTAPGSYRRQKGVWINVCPEFAQMIQLGAAGY